MGKRGLRGRLGAVTRALSDRVPGVGGAAPQEWLAGEVPVSAEDEEAGAPAETGSPAGSSTGRSRQEQQPPGGAGQTPESEPAPTPPSKIAADQQAPAKKAPAKKAPGKKAPAKKASAKKAPAKKAPVTQRAAGSAANETASPPSSSARKKAPAAPGVKRASTAKRATGAERPGDTSPADLPDAASTPGTIVAPPAASVDHDAGIVDRAPMADHANTSDVTLAEPPQDAPAARTAPTGSGSAPRRGEAAAAALPVREGEEPWTADEVAELQAELAAERVRLIDEIADADAQLAEMLRDAGEGSGDDQADVGSRTFEREQEISLAAGTSDMLDQVDRAQRRLREGSYGICENCGQPIGKLRLQAFPRATLCLACKAREERR